MSKNRELINFADLERWLNETRVTEIECLVPTLTGVARGKILPRTEVTEDRGLPRPEAAAGRGAPRGQIGTRLPRGGERAGLQTLSR